MIDNGYLFAKDNKRLFVNVNIGCLGNCSYCYLPIMGYSNNKIIKSTKTCEEIINMINNKKDNVKVNNIKELYSWYNKEIKQ